MLRNIFFIVFPLFLFFKAFKKPAGAESAKKIELKILFPGTEQKKSCRDVVVLLINHTDTVASFFEDWNSSGYYNIGFRIKTKNRVYLLNKKIKEAWTKNYPSWKVLFPGDTLRFEFGLNVQDFNCDYSVFDGVIPSDDTAATISTFYKLDPQTLDQAVHSFGYRLYGMIKYKKIFEENKEKGPGYGEWIIIDSLKEPVWTRKTFPLEKIESKEYKFN